MLAPADEELELVWFVTSVPSVPSVASVEAGVRVKLELKLDVVSVVSIISVVSVISVICAITAIFVVLVRHVVSVNSAVLSTKICDEDEEDGEDDWRSDVEEKSEERDRRCEDV